MFHLITSADAYDDVARRMEDVFRKHDFDVSRSEPPWWLDAPTDLLRKMGGKALRGFVPAQLAYWRGPRLEVALHPSDLLLRGKQGITAWAHGLVVEELARSEALQTFDPAAQALEKRIRRLWHLLDENPVAHRNSPVLRRGLSEVIEQLGGLDVGYEEWSVLYRECGQLSRAIEGRPQLLAKEDDMANDGDDERSKQLSKVAKAELAPVDPSSLPSTQLVGETAREAIALIKAQVELAKSELKEDLRSEVAAAKGLSVAAVAGLSGLSVLLVAAAFGLAAVMPIWAALLIVAGVMLLVAGIAAAIGVKKLRVPLQRTRKISGGGRPMGEGTNRVDEPSADELAEKVEASRERLDTLVAELDQRRHVFSRLEDLFGRHKVWAAAAGVVALGAIAAAVQLTLQHRRRQRTVRARLGRLTQALGRMVRKPERIAQQRAQHGEEGARDGGHQPHQHARQAGRRSGAPPRAALTYPRRRLRRTARRPRRE